MSANEKCPKCSSERLDVGLRDEYKCKSWYYGDAYHEFVQSELCKERELRQKAEAENAKLRELLGRALEIDAYAFTGTIFQNKIREEYSQLTK